MLKSQSVGMLPAKFRATITDAKVTAFYNYGDDRVIGCFVQFEITPDEVHNLTPQWLNYTSGKLENCCPAANAGAPIDWQNINLEDPDNDDDLTGSFLYSNLPEPWNKGHFDSKSNIAHFCTYLADAGFPTETFDYTEVEGCRAVDFRNFIGADVQFHEIEQPKRKFKKKSKFRKDDGDNETPKHHVIETFFGWAAGMAIPSSGPDDLKAQFAALMAAGVELPANILKLKQTAIKNSNVPGFDVKLFMALLPSDGKFPAWAQQHLTVEDDKIISD